MSLVISFMSESNPDVGVAVPVEEIHSIGSVNAYEGYQGSRQNDEPAGPAMDDGVVIQTLHGSYYVPGGNLKKCVEVWVAARAASKSALASSIYRDDAEEKKETCSCGPREACSECVSPKDDAEEKKPSAGQGTTTSTINIQAHVDESSTTSTWTVGAQDMDIERIRRRTELAASMLQAQTEIIALTQAERLLEREETAIRRLSKVKWATGAMREQPE